MSLFVQIALSSDIEVYTLSSEIIIITFVQRTFLFHHFRSSSAAENKFVFWPLKAQIKKNEMEFHGLLS